MNINPGRTPKKLGPKGLSLVKSCWGKRGDIIKVVYNPFINVSIFATLE